MIAITSNTAIRRMLAIVCGVVAVHAIALWALLGALSTRAMPEVIALQMTNPPAGAAAAQAVAVATPVAKPAAPAMHTPLQSAGRPAAAPAQPDVPATVATPAPPVITATGGAVAAVISAPSTASTATGGSASAVATASTGAVNAAAASHVELPSSDADYLHNPKPEYPRLSRQRNEQGKVVVNVYIGADGVAQKAELKVSSGFERLDAAAVATAKSWRYVPGKRGGVPEAMWFAVPIIFAME
jgi:protein TonB